VSPSDQPSTQLAPPTVDGGESCPRCGTAYAPGQEYCLECGDRLPDTQGVVPAISSAWKRRLPWYPGDWLWPVLAGLVVAGLAAAVALAVRDEGGPSTTVVATQPPAPPPAPTPPAPEPPEQTAPVPTAPAEPPAAPPRANVVGEWPPDTSGYTIVLESIPTSAGRRLARRKAQAAIDAGLEDVGVLNSSNYASLHPGYFVVFSGVFDSLAASQSALSTARDSGYPAAYARPITS
jgi:hypothetical protein